MKHSAFPLRVEVLLKTDSGYPRDEEVTYPSWQTLGVPFALRPIVQVHQSPTSRGPGKMSQ